MNKVNLAKVYFWILSVIFCVSCSNNEEPPHNPIKYKRTILVYMVASNSLAGNDLKDLIEIQTGLKEVDLENYNVVVYRASVNGKSTLTMLNKDNNNIISEQLIKEYDADESSVSPGRISTVINDMQIYSESEDYAIVLWSHAMGWIPSKLKFDDLNNANPTYFGDDFGKHINIDELAKAIPDNLFSVVWMDCCYMSNIETIYEFKNKCDWYVAYPTEILEEGIPYDKVIPKLLTQDIDLEGAAEATFDYYAENISASKQSCTIAIADMRKLSDLAIETRNVLSKFSPLKNTSDIQKYSRGSVGPFLDFRQYIESVAYETGTNEHLDSFAAALDNMIIYKNSTDKFLSLTIDKNNFSGVSVHPFDNSSDTYDSYYKTLSWYLDVYPKSE